MPFADDLDPYDWYIAMRGWLRSEPVPHTPQENLMHTKKLAYDYGLAVRYRDVAAEHGLTTFDELNRHCLRLWQRLIQAGAYADAEGSTLKPEYRDYYHAGLEAKPVEEWE